MTANLRKNPNPPANYMGGIAVTPDDAAENVFAGLYIGVSGDVKITGRDGQVAVYKSVPVGFFPIATKVVWSTGTVATNIIGLR